MWAVGHLMGTPVKDCELYDPAPRIKKEGVEVISTPDALEKLLAIFG